MLGAKVLLKAVGSQLTWTKLGNDIDGERTGDNSGYKISMNSDGDRVAIGALSNDDGGSSAGSVRVYSWDGTTWTQLGQDIDGEASLDQSSYSVSINSVGDRVAIGAVGNDGSGASAGSVRVYSLSGTTWTQLGQDIDGEAVNDQSGYSVSINSVGDRVAIGATGNDGSGASAGSVRVYSLSGTTWTKLGQDIDGEAADDFSGVSVSMNSVGDRVAIGATGNNGSGGSSGSVRVYSLSGTNWTKLGNDIDGEASNDNFGYSVSMNSDGDRVAIGARENDGNGSNAGSVRVYSLSGTTWTKLGQDIDGEAADDFSGPVSMNSVGDRVAIGATQNDGNGSNAGSVRVYSWDGTNWTKLGNDIDGEASFDNSGHSVSMNSVGDRVAIGAYGNDGSGSNAGSVRVYYK